MLARYFLTLGTGWLLVCVMAMFADVRGMLTTKQMQANGITVGINFENHGSTFWVIGALVPLTALLVSFYADQWSSGQWTAALVIGFVVSIGMHIAWTFVPFPDFMVAGPWKPSIAAYPHIVLFTGVVAVLILTYTCTPGLHPPVALLTATYIPWHVFVGNHMLEKAKMPPGFPPYPFWDAGPIVIICTVVIIMAGATWWALR